MKKSTLWRVAAVLGLLALIAFVVARALLANSFEPGPTKGAFDADNRCPVFRPAYPRCEVRFGNRGLSTLNSVYETFVGEGAFEIDSFAVDRLATGQLNITAQSNRGPIRSQILTDKVVRLGQDLENEKLWRTHQSAYCDGGRVYEHQVGYADDKRYVQNLEFWTEREAFRFRLFQDGRATADVVCRP